MALRTVVPLTLALVLCSAAPARADDVRIGAFDTGGAVPLQNISGLATSGSSVFVADVRAGVLRFDYAGRRIGRFAPRSAKNPVGLAAGTDGDVYVVRDGHVHRYRDNGVLLGRVGTTGSERVRRASGPIAVDDRGDVFIYDVNSESILSYDDAGAFRFRIAGLAGVNGIAVNAAGTRIYVATSSSAAPVVAFDEAGRPAGDAPQLQGIVKEATGVGVKPDGTIVVGGKGDSNKLVYVSPSDRRAVSYQLSGQPGQVATNCRGDVYVRIVSGDLSSSPDQVERYGDPARPAPPCGPRRAHGPFGGDADVAVAPDVRITYMEITQGVQPLGCPGCLRGRNLDYATDVVDPLSGARAVQLVNNHRTVVRVYADIQGPDAAVGDVPLVLSATVGGGGGTYGPVGPIQQPAAVVSGSGVATDTQRLSQTAAYTFEIPQQVMNAATLRGPLTLRAQIAPAGIPGSPPQCAGCKQNDHFTLRNIRPRQGPRLTIFPVALMSGERGGQFPTFPSGAPAIDPDMDLAALLKPRGDYLARSAGFGLAHKLIPGSLDVQPWRGFINIDEILKDPALSPDDRKKKVLPLLVDWIDEHDYDDAFVVGVTSTGGGPQGVRGVFSRGHIFNRDDKAIVALDRPLTNIMHEVGHAMGLKHASGCNTTDKDGHWEPWPPDEMGLLQGIGIDTLQGSGSGNGPFKLLGSTATAYCNDPAGADGPCADPPGGQTMFFDLMSYCTEGKEEISWISPRNWDRLSRADLNYDHSDAGRDYSAAPAAPTAIRVQATAPVTPSGPPAAITATAPTSRTGPARTPLPAYRFQLQDAAGVVLADVEAQSSDAHSDGPRNLERDLSAELPLKANAARIVLLHDKAPVSEVLRSPNAPRVRLIGIRARQRIGGRGSVTLRWSAADADGGALKAKIEYSVDAGRRWTLLTVGANRNQTRLPAGMLTASRRARIRVRVDDGFNSTTATSPVFVSLGAPPAVRISAPTAG